jgi:hypothetical protein
MIIANQHGLVIASNNDDYSLDALFKPGYFKVEGYAPAGTVLPDVGTGTGAHDIVRRVETADEVLIGVRVQRDALLKASDWTQLPDVPLTTKEAWATYRQALRDITSQHDPFNIIWPVAP